MPIDSMLLMPIDSVTLEYSAAIGKSFLGKNVGLLFEGTIEILL